ncbi:MAG: Rpn family recombination-promoting nuclease/putative transposase [bacterium]
MTSRPLRPRLGNKLHDSFFRVIFGGYPSAAAGALRAILPPRLAAALDFDRLEAMSGEFVTAALRQRRADLLFRVWLRDLEARLVWLFEQQAKPLRLMVWRGSDYTSAIWRAEVLEHRKLHRRDPDTLPAVIPVVLYTGRRPWSAPRRLTELIDLPSPLLEEARPFLPEMTLYVDPLHATPDEALRAREAGPLALLGWYLLKHAPGAQARIVRKFPSRGTGDRVPRGFAEGETPESYCQNYQAIRNKPSGCADSAMMPDSCVCSTVPLPPLRCPSLAARFGTGLERRRRCRSREVAVRRRP